MRSANKEDSKPLSEISLSDFPLFNKFSLQWASLFILLGVLYLPVIGSLIRMWWGSDDYSHGFLVPFISLYMVWTKRSRLKQRPIAPNFWIGAPLVTLAGLALLGGRMGGIVVLEEISLVLMIAGLVSLLMGKERLRIALLPILYLLFMIKIFGEGGDRFHWPFQLLAANIGVWLLQSLGFPAFREAQYIQLPHVTLEVAAACSGVRFLLSIIALGVPLAHFTQRTKFRKIGLTLFAVTIAILANGLRVALIGIWAYYGGSVVHGPFHIFDGIFVAWIGFAALFIGAWFLSKGPKEVASSARSEDGLSGAAVDQSFPGWGRGTSRRWNGAWRVAFALLLATAGVVYSYQNDPIPIEKGFGKIPMVSGDWRGRALDPRETHFRIEGPYAEMARVYTNSAGDAVDLYVGYFDKQEHGRDLVNYRTFRKFHRGEEEMEIPSGFGGSFRVNRAVLQEGGERREVFFWYDLNGRVVANRYRAKIWSLWDALKRGRTDGAIVVISAPFHPENDFYNGLQERAGLVREVLRSLHPLDGARS